jgi:periplasmic copper chaperone A
VEHRTRPWSALVAAALVVAVFATPALAHVDAETDDEPHPGAEVELRFAFHHGCAGQATTELAVRMPGGVDPDTLDAEEADGWEASVEDATVTWSGGEPIPDHVAHAFRLHLVLPAEPGETIPFPTIQRCGEDEIAWIQVPEEGENWSELSEPAPVLTLTDREPPDADPETAPAVEETSPSQALEQPEEDDVEDDGEAIVAGDEANPWIIVAALAGIVMLAVIATGGVLMARRGSD